jgi:hypothetical protein
MAEIVVGVEQGTTVRNRPAIEFQSSASPMPRYPPDGKERGPMMSAGARMRIDEIARRLDMGRLAVYTMLEQGIIPSGSADGGSSPDTPSKTGSAPAGCRLDFNGEPSIR